MQSIDFKQIDKLSSDVDKLLKNFPKMRRDLHEQFASVIKNHVDTEIGRSLKDSSGKIKRWQGKYVGTGGGYAAVRAVDTSVGKNSPGAITNYLENGHKIRRPSGKNKYYKPRRKKIYVDGFHFYAKASNTIENDIMDIAEKFADDLVNELM